MAVVDVGIVINARNNAGATIQQVQQQLNGLNGGAGRATRSFRGLGQSILGTVSRFNTLSAAVFIVAQSIRVLAGGLVEAISDGAQLNIMLTTITGSSEAAADQLQRLNETFSGTAFTVQEVGRNLAQLRGAGLGLADANRTLEATAAAVAAFGGNQGQLDRAALALSQVASKGIASMEELRGQLSEAVPGALRIMADQAGISVPEFTEQVRRGMVSSEEAIRLFTEGAEQLFGNFLELSRNTLPGAFSAFLQSWSVGFAQLAERTSIDERLTLIFQDLTKIVDDFFDSLSEEDVVAFMNAIDDLGDIIGDLFEGLGQVIEALGSFVGLIEDITFIDFPSSIRDWETAFLDFGAAVAFTTGQLNTFYVLQQQAANVRAEEQAEEGINALRLLEQHMDRVRREILSQRLSSALDPDDREDAPINRQAMRQAEQLSDLAAEIRARLEGAAVPFADDLVRVFNRLEDITGVASDLSLAMEGAALEAEGLTREMIGAAIASDQASKGVGDIISRIQGGSIAIFVEQLRAFRRETQRTINEVQAAQLQTLAELGSGAAAIAAAVARVNLEYDRQRDILEEELRQLNEVNNLTKQEGERISEIQRLLDQNVTLRQREVELARATTTELERQRLAQLEIVAAQLRQQAAQTRREFSTNPIIQAVRGTQAGEVIERVAAQRVQMQSELERLQQQAAEIAIQLQSATGQVRDKLLEAQAASISAISAQAEAMAALSEGAIIANELWQKVGQTIEQGVGDALFAVITSTGDLEDIGRQMFNALTRAAIEYLVQLYLIQAVKAASSFFGAADGGVFSGPVTKAAAGAVMTNSIIRGPTMFQAGEAGEEAIMPLTRVNGKLGVASNGGGGGGDNFQININAIDAQSGVEFLMKNRGVIISSLRHEMFLNKGLDRVRP